MIRPQTSATGSTWVRTRAAALLLMLMFMRNLALTSASLSSAGFRRSFCLWRRTSHRRRRQSCTSCSPTLSSLSSPYEEVRLYQRHPEEKHRLIVLTGETLQEATFRSGELKDTALSRKEPSGLKGSEVPESNSCRNQENVNAGTLRNTHFCPLSCFSIFHILNSE